MFKCNLGDIHEFTLFKCNSSKQILIALHHLRVNILNLVYSFLILIICYHLIQTFWSNLLNGKRTWLLI
jgi:hypothetical protein